MLKVALFLTRPLLASILLCFAYEESRKRIHLARANERQRILREITSFLHSAKGCVAELNRTNFWTDCHWRMSCGCPKWIRFSEMTTTRRCGSRCGCSHRGGGAAARQSSSSSYLPSRRAVGSLIPKTQWCLTHLSVAALMVALKQPMKCAWRGGVGCRMMNLSIMYDSVRCRPPLGDHFITLFVSSSPISWPHE